MNEDFTITVKGLTQDDMLSVDILEHFPELQKAYWSGTFYPDKAIIEMSVKITMEHKILSAYRTGRTKILGTEEKQVLDVVLKVINNKIDSNMSDYQKELAIHDYIVMNCTYDSINYYNDTIPDSSYNSYGALVLGVAVCQGYSGAFKLFMDMLNIECDIITGQADGESHSWNRVKIDGDYYLVDVTWNASISNASISSASTSNASISKENRNIVVYDFFNLTDKAMSASHTPNRPQTKVADSTRYNYFYYNNLVVSSKKEFLAVLQNALSKNENYVYVLYENVDLRKLVNSQDIFQYLGGSTRVLYSFSEKVNTLYLQFE